MLYTKREMVAICASLNLNRQRDNATKFYGAWQESKKARNPKFILSALLEMPWEIRQIINEALRPMRNLPLRQLAPAA